MSVRRKYVQLVGGSLRMNRANPCYICNDVVDISEGGAVIAMTFFH